MSGKNLGTLLDIYMDIHKERNLEAKNGEMIADLWFGTWGKCYTNIWTCTLRHRWTFTWIIF